MDLLDVAILVLRLALVAVLYAFLLLVMRAAARGLRAAPRTPASTETVARAAELRLIVLEPGGSELRSGQVIELAADATLGRSTRAEVVLADAAVSAQHARVFRVGRAWVVTDLGSTNGTRVNETMVNGETPLAPDDVLALGSVRLQVVRQ
jgi:hypothetical protein